MNAPGPNTSVKVWQAGVLDRPKCYDIDIKCFDDVWDMDSWLQWFEADRVVYLAELDNKDVGFAVCTLLSDGIFIEKIGVKPACRLQGVSTRLLSAIRVRAQTREWPYIVSLTVPETFLSPGRPGDISGWIAKVGFRAKPPLQPDFFYINGENIDGVPCLLDD